MYAHVVAVRGRDKNKLVGRHLLLLTREWSRETEGRGWKLLCEEDAERNVG